MMKQLRLIMNRQPRQHGSLSILHATLLLLTLPFLADIGSIDWGPAWYQLSYPQALSGKLLPEDPNVVSISATTGVVRISAGVEMALPLVDPGELIPYLESRPAGILSKPVVIHADRSTRYDRIDEVLTALKSAGVREVYFFTDLPEPTNA